MHTLYKYNNNSRDCIHNIDFNVKYNLVRFE